MMFVDQKHHNYTVSNYDALFRIGAKYFDEFKKGLRSFAIGSMGYERSQQTTLLGVASYFDLKQNLKICIVSDNLYSGVFQDLVAACDIKEMPLSCGERLRFQKFYEHFDFVDLADLIYKKMKGENLTQVIEDLRKNYDVIFWDIPELHRIRQDLKTFSSIIRAFDFVGVVASSTKQSEKNTKEIKDFFLEHGISVNGMVFNSSIVSKKKRRSFWGLCR